MMTVTKQAGRSPAVLVARSELYAALRQDLRAQNCHEVSTPILCPHPDIAPVPQFVTQHPGRSEVGCMRIAPTEYLKQLLVDGAHRVYEFATNFRADEPDDTHLPEFTSLEVMCTRLGCPDMQNWTERLCKAGIRSVRDLERDPYYQPPGGRPVDLSRPWLRESIRDLFRKRHGFGSDDFFNRVAVDRLHRAVLARPAPESVAEAIDCILMATCTDLEVPVFVSGYPTYLGGPARPCSDDPRFKERSELFLGTFELANMSTTLTDPAALRAWHHDGVAEKERLGFRPNTIDAPLLAAVERGIPESAVLGIGIDRLVMVALGLVEVASARPFPYGTLYPNGGSQ